jgi:hypothetical protein
MNKQETLEEAAERIAYNSTEENKGFPSIKMFIQGAKWQQERMYSEEEVKQMLIDCCGEVYCEDGTLMGKTPVELYKWIDKQFKKK